MENEFINSLVNLYERDLTKLETEIKLYTDTASLWTVAGDIKNSGGNLCLHLCGNLQHFIGHILGKSNYVRNREYEFSAKGLSAEVLVAEIQKTLAAVKSTLLNLDKNLLTQAYPAQPLNYPMTTMFFLIHLESHLEYHLGQINYHRRLM